LSARGSTWHPVYPFPGSSHLDVRPLLGVAIGDLEETGKLDGMGRRNEHHWVCLNIVEISYCDRSKCYYLANIIDFPKFSKTKILF
jgi:hypothetical protein